MENGYRFRLGSFDCLAVNDGGYDGTAAMLFTNAPDDALQGALGAHGLEPDSLPSTWTCLLVETGDQTVLIDTGGNKVAGLGGGKLVPAMAAAGITPGDVDIVILTHGHGDHIGGAVDADGLPAFANARYVMWQSEWDYWRSEANLARMSEWAARMARKCLLPLATQMETIDAETEIVPGIRALAAPGHTVGHMALEIHSGDEKLLHMVDAVLHPIHLEHPDWVAMVDSDPVQTVATREVLCRRAVQSEALVLAFHFSPFPSLGHVVESGAGWRWRPI